MATLYEIDRAIESIIETGFSWDEETGEVLFEEKDLDGLQVAFEEKLEACGIWMKNQKALAAAIREEEKVLAERRKAIERKMERMDGYVLRHIAKIPKARIETPKVAMSTRKSQKVIVDNESLLPSKFVREVTSIKPDKVAIGKALKAGETVDGAFLENSVSLQLK